MSAVEQFTPSVLTLTDKAVAKVRSLVESEANDDLKLRVFVTGGGWSLPGYSSESGFATVHRAHIKCTKGIWWMPWR